MNSIYREKLKGIFGFYTGKQNLINVIMNRKQFFTILSDAGILGVLITVEEVDIIYFKITQKFSGFSLRVFLDVVLKSLSAILFPGNDISIICRC